MSCGKPFCTPSFRLSYTIHASRNKRSEGIKRTAIVVGGGVVGAAIAVRLQQRGLRTLLIDPQDGSAASLGAAGHIATEQVVPLASVSTIRSAPGRWFPLGGAFDVREPLAFLPWAIRFAAASTPRRLSAGTAALRNLLSQSLPAWRRLARDVGRPELLLEDGHLVVWETPAAAARGRALWCGTDLGEVRVRPLEGGQLETLRSVTSRCSLNGLRFEGTAQLSDLDHAAAALEAAFLQSGGAMERTRARALERCGGKAVVVRPEGRRLSADVIVIAAGAGSPALMSGIGPRPPLIFERGYHLRWAEHDWPDKLPPVVFEDRSVIVTRFRRHLQLASFVEFGGPSAPPDPRKWKRLAEHAAALRLPVCGEPTRWVGARPTLPDYLPAIGRSRTADNLLYAFGHQHLGLTLAPVTAECIAALATEKATAVPLAPFDLGRFHRRVH